MILRSLVKILSLPLCFSLLGVCVLAAASVTENDLERAFSKYRSLATLNADFKQTTTIKDMDLPVKSEGHLKLVRSSGSAPGTVTWEVDRPSYLKAEFKGEEMTVQTDKSGKVQTFKKGAIPDEKQAKSLELLVTLMKFDVQALAKNFVVTKVNKAHYRFQPRQPGPFQSVDMELSKDGLAEQVRIEESSGDVIEIRFQNIKTSQSAS